MYNCSCTIHSTVLVHCTLRSEPAQLTFGGAWLVGRGLPRVREVVGSGPG
eukprot:COSAG02_NODE_33403_length_500_cov_1.189526_1_plen_49_part_01